MQQISKFKKTELGEIPEHWIIVNLGEHVELRSGKSNPTKNLSENNLIPVYGANGITGFFTEHIMEIPTIVVGRVGEYAGSIHITKGKSWITDNAIYFSKLPDFMDVNFLGSFLILYDLGRLAEKTGQPKLTQVPIKQIKLPLPPLKEQQKITLILSNVGELIQKTEQIIEQTQRFKKGLMQKLLTKGIGHTKFKNTKFGEIPKEWEAKTLVDICNTVRDGSHFSPKHQDMGFPLATVTNMKDNYIDIDSCYKISKEDYDLLVKNGCKLESGDVLFSKDGTVGLSLVYNQNKPLVVLSSIAILRPKKEILNPYFTKYVLQSEVILGRILGARTGTALRRIILKDLRKITIPIPQLKEQQKIISILSTFDLSLKNYNNYKLKIENLKKGLMQQLLTGKIRVKV